MPQTGIYGYCVILNSEPLTFGNVTMGSMTSKSYTIHFRDLSMVVSRGPYVLPPRRENVFAHQEVINRVLESYTVVPLSFGNVFRSENDVVIFLEKLYEPVLELLPKLENKIEMGLIVFGKKEWFQKELEADHHLSEIKRNLEQMSSDEAYYERIKGGEVAKRFFNKLQQQVIEGIYKPLAALSDSVKLNEPVGDRALLNAAFLINKESEPIFDNMVFELYEQWQDKMEFRYSGPWPVYNFVNIKLMVE